MTNPKRILIVEDDALIAMDLQFICEDAGWQVIGPAGTLEKGLELADQNHIDIGVLDMNLRSATSYPIAQALVGKNVPVVFLSGSEGDDRPDDIKDVLVIAKPVDTQQLLEVLNTHMTPPQAVAS
jgi:DNA-binding response OmpR family regulator